MSFILKQKAMTINNELDPDFKANGLFFRKDF